MGSGPKKQDYEPTASDKALAKQNYKDWQKFQDLYNPKLLELKAASESGDVTRTLKGRANADTMQKVSGPSYVAATKTDNAGLLGSALSGQLGDAGAKGKKFQNDLQTSILATRQGQAGVANQGLTALAKMDTTERLKSLENKQMVDAARSKMTGQLAMASLSAGNEAGLFGKGKTSQFITRFTDNVNSQG
jgi:hypothetical protein